jgi:hypothetical protein
MKKQILMLALFLCCCKMTGNAQVWFDLGAKGAWGLTNLYNTNVSNDRLYKYKLNTGYKFGGKFGINFGDHNGIAFEGLVAKNNQKWEYSTTSGNTNGVDTLLHNNISWNALDIYVLYRYMNDRSYIELGPKLTRVGKIKQTDDKLLSVTDVSPYYNPQLLGACLGFGGYLGGSNTFSTQLGIRLEYAFTDFISSAGQPKGYPNPIRKNTAFYDKYVSTNALSAQVTLEFNFGVGGYAQAACGRRGFFLFKND